MTTPAAAPAPPATCLARMYAESGLSTHVDPSIVFPRAGGLLAARLARTRSESASAACASCAGDCTLRPFVAGSAATR